MTSSDSVPDQWLPRPLGLREAPTRGCIRIQGPDAADYLHRLSSQDIEGLRVGGAAHAAFLDPKGKLVALAVIARLDDARFLVLPPLDMVETLATLLDRYHFTEKLEQAVDTPAGGAELVGFGACTAAGMEPGTVQTLDDGSILVATARFGVERVLLLGPADAVSGWVERMGVEPWAPAWSEVLRMRGGEVRAGIDVDERTLGLEAHIDDHVSTTKGCYTGQEIVARIHTYGHVNRRLVLLRIDGVGGIEPGTRLCETEDGDAVGRVTSFVEIPDAGERLALGVVPNAFVEPGSELTLGDRGGAGVTVLDFPSA